MLEAPYYINYSPTRATVHSVVTSKYFDLAISAVIGLNVITMAMEFYMMPNVNILHIHLPIQTRKRSQLSSFQTFILVACTALPATPPPPHCPERKQPMH